MQEMMTFSKEMSLFFILFVFITTSSALGQDRLMDNWEEELSKAQGQERINLIAQISKNITDKDSSNEDLAKVEEITKEGMELAATLGDSSAYHQIRINLGMIFYRQNEVAKGLPIAMKSLDYYNRLHVDTDEKARAQLCVAMLLFEGGNYTTTDSLLIQSENIYRKTNNLKEIRSIYSRRGSYSIRRKEYPTAKKYLTEALRLNAQLEKEDDLSPGILMNLGIVENNLGNLPEALEKYLQALETITNDFLKAKCLHNISGLYIQLEEWDTALEYAEEALALNRKLGAQPAGIALTLERIGIIHKKKMNYGKALTYYKECLAIRRKMEGKHSNIENTISNIGNVYLNLGEIAKAMEHYEEALAFAESNSNWKGICNARCNMGHALFRAEDYETALLHLTECYKIALEKESAPYLEFSCAVLGESYTKLGDKEMAELYEGQYHMIRDSVFSISKIKRIGNIEQQFKSDTENDSLKLVLDAYENSRGAARRNLFLYAIGFLMLGIVGVLAYFKFKTKLENEVQGSQNADEISNKLDRYFEELLCRFEEKGLSTPNGQDIKDNESYEITNMTAFLVENLSTESDWRSFEHYFTKVHKDFFRDLKTAYPKITTSELNLCALLKLNIPNKEIAQILGISYGSVRKAQHRLAQKIDIPSNQILRDFIIKL